MVEDNVQARESGIAVTGDYVLFYERQPTHERPTVKKPRSNHSTLIQGLKALGLAAVTTEQVESALTARFPKGTNGQDETEVLRAIFRHLKCSGVG